VKFHLNRFLRRVRIHGGEFDTSARAMYREGVTSSLRADLRIVRRSTIERKQMSTKTTFKRIALVTVAALGFGVMSVAPSSAATNANLGCYTADGITAQALSTAGNDTCGGIAGAYNQVTLVWTALAVGDVIEVTGGTFVSGGANATLNTAKTAAVATATTANGLPTVATPTAGTITVKFYKNTNGVVSSTATETVTITVGAAGLAGVYSAAKTTSYIVAGETLTAAAGAAISADATVSAAKTVVADTATATIVVNYIDGLGKPMGAKGDTLTATITSGPGTIRTSSATIGGNPYVSFDSTTARSATGTPGDAGGVTRIQDQYTASVIPETMTGLAAFYVFANNLPGVTTVTIKNAAGTVIATKSLTFTDTAIATIEATVLKATVNGDSAVHTSDVIKLVLKDAAGAVIKAPSAYPTVTSGTTTIGGASQSGVSGFDTATATDGFVNWGVDAVGEKYGDVVYTFKAGLVTATATVKFVSKVASTLDITAATATAGDKITYTITAKDSTGAAIPDGSLLSNYVKSAATTGGIATEVDVTTANKSSKGSWTVTGIAPLISTTLKTTFTLTGTAATADTNLVKDLAATTKVVEVAVTNPATDAAAAAAEEATAAANDATDAALSAAEAAEAATAMAQEAVDAVAELSASVTKLISALRAQITTLTNLVVKIQKKVKA
jgi:trimeric autotransporter adhesin